MKKVSDQISEVIADHIDGIAAGDEVSWELFPMPPNEMANNLYMVVINMPSPIMGQMMQVGGGIQVGYPLAPEGIIDGIRQLMEQLRIQRSKILSDTTQVNGTEPGKGLIIP